MRLNESRPRANVRQCVRADLLIPRTEWLRRRPRSGETLALQTGRLCPQARIPAQVDPVLVERVMPPIPFEYHILALTIGSGGVHFGFRNRCLIQLDRHAAATALLRMVAIARVRREMF